MNKRGVNCSSFVFLFLLGMGIFFVVSTVQDMQAADASSNWLSTSGKIEDTWIEHERRTDVDGDSESYYLPHIQYSYQVNDRMYKSEKVDFSPQPSYGSESRAKKFVGKYQVDSQVEVFYDPTAPAEAVLVREASGATWSLIAGGAMVIFSIAGWIGLLLKGKRLANSTTEVITLPR